MAKSKKPYKGRIRLVPSDGSFGILKHDGRLPLLRGKKYVLICQFLDHPQFAGRVGHTSEVVKETPGGWVETRNSRYRIVK